MTRPIFFFMLYVLVVSCSKPTECYQCRRIDTGTGKVGTYYEHCDDDIRTYQLENVQYYQGFDKVTYKRYVSCH